MLVFSQNRIGNVADKVATMKLKPNTFKTQDVFKEGFWIFFLGWQYVALGALIVVVVVFFPEGIMGWIREKYPERFGEVIDEADRKAQIELK